MREHTLPVPMPMPVPLPDWRGDKRTLRWPKPFLLALTCLAACAGAPRPPSAPRGLSGLHYEVHADPELSRLDVELCFDGAPPPRLIFGTRNAARFLRDPRSLHPTQHPLPVQDGRILLEGPAANSCIAYTLDLRAALDFDSLMLAYPGEGSLLFSSDLFLWRPERRSPELRSSVRFQLPDGMQVSTPWQAHADHAGYTLDERAFAFTGHLVIGRFDEQPLAAPGGELRAVIMNGFPEPTAQLLTPWLQRAAAVASLPGERFPVTGAQLIVVPTSPSPFPIHFGHTGRSGGASIVLFVPTDVDAAALQKDWIAIHELSHLWHPFIRREDAWLSEGLATYLQEVLRVRAGLEPASEAWHRLYDGAQLGRDTSHTLEDETRRMAYEHNYQRVYWAGAAIALLIDVDLRKHSGGRSSLDQLLARLRERPALFMRAVSARELLTALDELAGAPVCQPIAARYMSGPLPDLAALYGELGLTSSGAAISGEHHAPLAWVRDAIMAEATETLRAVAEHQR